MDVLLPQLVVEFMLWVSSTASPPRANALRNYCHVSVVSAHRRAGEETREGTQLMPHKKMADHNIPIGL